MKGYHTRNNGRNWKKDTTLYRCDHPIYSKCTLFKMGEFEERGLAVIQQRFNEIEKVTWWGPIDQWLAADIVAAPEFLDYFIKHSDMPEEGIYPTIEVRKLMHAIGMKPLRKECWETSLDSQKLRLL